MKRAMVVLTILALAEAHAGAGAQSRPGPDGRELLSQGRYAQALPAIERELAAKPSDAGLLGAKVDALMGLRRFEEAARIAFPLTSSQPAMAFRAARCLFEQGRIEQALQLWSSLRSDGAWAGPAYARLVQVLAAAGREADARTLAREGLARLPSPPPELGLWDLELEPTASGRVAALDALARLDPSSADRYRGLRRLYAEAGGAQIGGETLTGSLPAVLPLGENRSPRDVTGLVTPGPRVPKGPAPSAVAYDHGEYNPMPPQLGTLGGAAVPETNAVVVRVTVPVAFGSGGQLAMALDSSAGALGVPASMVEKLGLAAVKGPACWSPRAAPEKGASWVLVPSIQVGPVALTNVPAVVIEGGDATGVLPLWLLRHYGLLLDRRAASLTLLPAGTPPSGALGAGATAAPCPWLERRPFLSIRAGQGSPFYVLLDTDAACSYIETRHVSEVGASRPAGRSSRALAVESFGAMSVEAADDVVLSWGGLRVAMPGVRTAPLAPGLSVDTLGLLGRDVLDHFQLYLDYTTGLAGFKACPPAK